VRPKFKYDDKKTTDFQAAVAEELLLRDRPGDPGARTQLLRRWDARLAGARTAGPESCPVEH
jgi:transcriptional regulator